MNQKYLAPIVIVLLSLVGLFIPIPNYGAPSCSVSIDPSSGQQTLHESKGWYVSPSFYQRFSGEIVPPPPISPCSSDQASKYVSTPLSPPPPPNRGSILMVAPSSPSTPILVDDVITADWKTYTNTTYNFSLKYSPKLKLNADACIPSSQKVEKYNQVQFICTVNLQSYPYKPSGGAILVETNPGAPNGLIIDLNMYANPKNFDLHTFLSASEEGLHHADLFTQSKVNINNQEFIQETTRDSSPLDLGNYWIKDSHGFVYEILGTIFAKDGQYTNVTPQESGDYKNIFMQVLASFKRK